LWATEKNWGVLDLPKLHASAPDVFDIMVFLGTALRRIFVWQSYGFNLTKGVGVCDTVDRLRFHEKERVVHMVTTTVQEMRRKPLMK